MSESTAPLDETLKKITNSDQPESSGDQSTSAKTSQPGSSDPFSDQVPSSADPTVPLDYDPKVALEQGKAASDFNLLPVGAQVAVVDDDDEKKAAAKELADKLNSDIADTPAFTLKWKDGEPQNKPGEKLNNAPKNVLIL